jgi:hypothetical protein
MAPSRPVPQPACLPLLRSFRVLGGTSAAPIGPGDTRTSCETPGARMGTRRHLPGTPWRREGVSPASSGSWAARHRIHLVSASTARHPLPTSVTRTRFPSPHLLPQKRSVFTSNPLDVERGQPIAYVRLLLSDNEHVENARTALVPLCARTLARSSADGSPSCPATRPPASSLGPIATWTHGALSPFARTKNDMAAAWIVAGFGSTRAPVLVHADAPSTITNSFQLRVGSGVLMTPQEVGPTTALSCGALRPFSHRTFASASARCSAGPTSRDPGALDGDDPPLSGVACQKVVIALTVQPPKRHADAHRRACALLADSY